MEVCALGFLMLWASSRITRAQTTRMSGGSLAGWVNERLRAVHFILMETNGSKTYLFITGGTQRLTLNVQKDLLILEISRVLELKWPLYTDLICNILTGLLWIFLLDGNLLGNQAVGGNHHVVFCKT